MKRLLIVATLPAMLTACMSLGHVDYECSLADVPQAKCASLEDAYTLSNNSKRSGTRGQSVFAQPATKAGKPDSKAADSSAQPYFRGEASGYPDAAQQGAPVFKQPKVMRVWVAPYVDADGNLRSGEYTYFATPGAWNYGSLTKAGAASGATFEPTKPNQLGFNPSDKKPVTPASPTPSKPPESKPAPATSAAASQAPATAGGITQPYQRLAN